MIGAARACGSRSRISHLTVLSPDIITGILYRVRRRGRLQGWVWQGDLTEEKSASMRARIDEHNRKVEEFHANRQAAGRLIDIETCELFRMPACDDDPYGIKLVPYPQWGTNRFVGSEDSDGWIHEADLPVEKARAMYDRIWRERVAREK
jgi:hypothetical protein